MRRVFEQPVSQAAAICFIHFCAVFLRSHPSERFRYVCPRSRPVYRRIHMRCILPKIMLYLKAKIKASN